MFYAKVQIISENCNNTTLKFVKTNEIYWFQYEIGKLNVYSDIQHPHNFYTILLRTFTQLSLHSTHLCSGKLRCSGILNIRIYLNRRSLDHCQLNSRFTQYNKNVHLTHKPVRRTSFQNQTINFTYSLR